MDIINCANLVFERLVRGRFDYLFATFHSIQIPVDQCAT